MKLAIIYTQEGFNQADQAKLDQVKTDLQKALDNDTNIVVILPPFTNLDVQTFDDDYGYGGEGDEDSDEVEGE